MALAANEARREEPAWCVRICHHRRPDGRQHSGPSIISAMVMRKHIKFALYVCLVGRHLIRNCRTNLAEFCTQELCLGHCGWHFGGEIPKGLWIQKPKIWRRSGFGPLREPFDCSDYLETVNHNIHFNEVRSAGWQLSKNVRLRAVARGAPHKANLCCILVIFQL